MSSRYSQLFGAYLLGQKQILVCTGTIVLDSFSVPLPADQRQLEARLRQQSPKTLELALRIEAILKHQGAAWITLHVRIVSAHVVKEFQT